MTEPLPAALRPHFRAVAQGVLPPTREYADEDWARAEAVVAQALRDRPPGMLRQLHLFLRVVNLLPLFTRGRTLRRLPPEAREAFLLRLQDARLLPIRRGVWGLRTLAFMGHYGRPEVHGTIGYGARLRGWREHPDGAGRERP
jgi:hypothetical protein